MLSAASQRMTTKKSCFTAHLSRRTVRTIGACFRPPRAVGHGLMLLPAQPKQGSDPDCSLREVQHSVAVREELAAGAVAADQGSRPLTLVSGFQPEQSDALSSLSFACGTRCQPHMQ